MTWTKNREVVLKMKFEDIYGRYDRREMTSEEASIYLGMSTRNFLRKRRLYESEGFDGNYDRRLGRRSGRRADDKEVERLTKLYKDRYEGFSVKHFHEFAVRVHNLQYGYTWMKTTLIEAGLVKKEKRGGPHRKRRERRPMEGMMIHQDASTHDWIPGLGHKVDLIVTMDDATSRITSAFFTDQEGTRSSLQGIKETVERNGLFCSFYTDRGSHYWTTPEANGRVDKRNLTQVGRALKQLKIEHIAAYSPQARGRSERMFSTLQGRLPKEFVLAGITTVEEANKYLQETYLNRHNEQFTVVSTAKESAFVPWKGESLDEVLCLTSSRCVKNDNTVDYNSLHLQIHKDEARNHYVKAQVEVREYLDGTLAVFHGHRCLGRYTAKGEIINDLKLAA